MFRFSEFKLYFPSHRNFFQLLKSYSLVVLGRILFAGSEFEIFGDFGRVCSSVLVSEPGFGRVQSSVSDLNRFEVQAFWVQSSVLANELRFERVRSSLYLGSFQLYSLEKRHLLT